MMIRFGIVTISDRSSRGEREDLSGPALSKLVTSQGWDVCVVSIIPDEFEAIKKNLTELCDQGLVDIILTTGGTGFAPRDITPEATEAVIERKTPGICELIRMESLKLTPFAALSRAVSGIRNRTLIINLPGNPKGAVESLAFVMNLLPHAIELLRNHPDSEAGHKKFPAAN